MEDKEISELSSKVIGCAIEVHRFLGAGLLESAYSRCLCHELLINSIPFEAEVQLPVLYKGCSLDCGYRIDIVVDRKIIVELKSVDKLKPIHKAQILSYMKLANIKKGLLINFNTVLLKDGLQSYVR